MDSIRKFVMLFNINSLKYIENSFYILEYWTIMKSAIIYSANSDMNKINWT